MHKTFNYDTARYEENVDNLYLGISTARNFVENCEEIACKIHGLATV